MSENEAAASVDVVSNDASLEQQSVQEEKMLPQSEVNRIIGDVKRREREALEKRYNESSRSNERLPVFDESLIDKRVNEIVSHRESEAQKQYALLLQQQEDERIRDDLVQKINECKSNYDDYDSVVNGEFLEGSDELLRAVNTVPNSGDVLYHLGKNLLKVGSLRNLTDAQKKAAIRKLSKSIEANQSASSTSLAANPLRQTKPSSNSAKGRKIDTISWKC